MYPYPEQKIIHERSHAKCSALHRCYVSSSELLWVRLHLQLGWMNWFESLQEKTPGSYQFGRRHATIIFEDWEHAWKNASIWLRKHVRFKMSHNLRGFSWILLGAGSARHHKEPFFFFASEIYLSCEVWKAVVHFFWSSVHLEVLRQTFVEMSCQTRKTPSDQLVLHTR